MRTTLRVLAALLFIAALGLWLAKGANRGWTKNQVPVKIVDEVTGIEGVRWEKRFVPGVEFLGAGGVPREFSRDFPFCFTRKELAAGTRFEYKFQIHENHIDHLGCINCIRRPHPGRAANVRLQRPKKHQQRFVSPRRAAGIGERQCQWRFWYDYI